MENEKNRAICSTKPAKSFLSALNAKRKRLAFCVTMMMATMMATAATAFADDGGGPGNAGEEQFNKVIKLFADWIGRIGLVVTFVGAIMFALSIKNDDAEAKTRGLMTLASGIVVFAVTKSLDLFGIIG